MSDQRIYTIVLIWNKVVILLIIVGEGLVLYDNLYRIKKPQDRIISLNNTVEVTQIGIIFFAESTMYDDASMTLSARGSRIDPR